ncbi:MULTISPECIES: hypothetical protein [Candidatus Neomicrothrix]|nr:MULTISPECIES: hypothetical protein [Microthrix]HMS47548.1 hypothetical protein [Candidatus Microthrix sp.]
MSAAGDGRCPLNQDATIDVQGELLLDVRLGNLPDEEGDTSKHDET